MKEELVSHKTAKLAQEKGFDWDCNYVYDYRFYSNKNKIELFRNAGVFGDCKVFCPTQSLLQKYLRDKHRIFIEIKAYSDNGDIEFGCDVWDSVNRKLIIFVDDVLFNTYEDALERGLQEGLKMVV